MWKTIIPSPVGNLQALATTHGLRALLWPNADSKRFATDADCTAPTNQKVFVDLTNQLDEYFAGKRSCFELPLDLQGTEFQLLAWEALRTIPFGNTRSYAEQAAEVGRPTAVRAIGTANGRNPVSIVVPCHRVIGKHGSLCGFAGGIEVKRFLLDHELKFAPKQ